MRSTRISWPDLCALLAILLGVVVASDSLGETNWPAHEGSGTIDGSCYAMTGYCCKWEKACKQRGTAGYKDEYFQCTPGGTVWQSLEVIDTKAWGECQGSTPAKNCVKYSKYYCAYIEVYKELDCPTAKSACKWFAKCTDLCDPDAAPPPP